MHHLCEITHNSQSAERQHTHRPHAIHSCEVYLDETPAAAATGTEHVYHA